jgi:uncharacterized protein DUF4154
MAVHQAWMARFALAALMWVAGGAARAAEDRAESLELQVKAAFLYSFAKFVDWPINPAGTTTTITFCVLADQPLFESLEQSVRGKNINGRSLAARQMGGPEDMHRCQLLFLGASSKKRAGEILDKLGDASVLTVGDSEQFTQRGGMIQLTKDASRFRFAVNVDAVGRAGLKISSKLLQLAEVVHDSEAKRKKP